jgi:hypothetical protein
MTESKFDQLSVDNVFHREKHGIKISIKLADFLMSNCKVNIISILNKYGNRECFWDRDSSLPLSEDLLFERFVIRNAS